eukprot:m.233425 g.233425  ORF g.233425 m.233425 type:complete len:608 (-) comp12514_c0_seq1:47-1870(-)
MPKVDIKRELLFQRLGLHFSKEELEKKAQDDFQTLCFEFGLELDDVTSEKLMMEKEQRDATRAEGLSEEVIYKIDIPANRYDLLCLEGLARGLNVFREKVPLPKFERVEPAAEHKQVLNITANTAAVRPYAVAAVLRGVTFTEASYNSFIDLQEKLHQNICRKRSLVAIGTHDLDTIQGPFTYDAEPPADIKFKPLRAPDMTKEYTAAELMVAYEADQQLKHYLHIIRGKERFPVIRDRTGVVLSMPPIINGHHSRITMATRNVFIECTATDQTKADIVLNMIVCAFSEYATAPFTVEAVTVNGPAGPRVTPNLAYRTERVSVESVYARMGIPRDVTPQKIASLLTRMQLTATLADGDKTLLVEVPPTRPDVLHECDIWEDVAISYGFNNITWTVPKVVTVGKQLPINKLTDQLRVVVAQSGYNEALTFALCKLDDNFKGLRRPDDGSSIIIANPATAEFQVARTNLLSGLLKTVAGNVKMPLPIKVFEISDVVLKDDATDTGARNRRRLGALLCGRSAAFQDVQGLLDRVMLMLGVPYNATKDASKPGYYLLPSADPAFFSEVGAADIIVGGKRLGVVGVVHPEVLAHYELRNPCSALELELEAFL